MKSLHYLIIICLFVLSGCDAGTNKTDNSVTQNQNLKNNNLKNNGIGPSARIASCGAGIVTLAGGAATMPGGVDILGMFTPRKTTPRAIIPSRSPYGQLHPIVNVAYGGTLNGKQVFNYMTRDGKRGQILVDPDDPASFQTRTVDGGNPFLESFEGALTDMAYDNSSGTYAAISGIYAYLIFAPNESYPEGTVKTIDMSESGVAELTGVVFVRGDQVASRSTFYFFGVDRDGRSVGFSRSSSKVTSALVPLRMTSSSGELPRAQMDIAAARGSIAAFNLPAGSSSITKCFYELISPELGWNQICIPTNDDIAPNIAEKNNFEYVVTEKGAIYRSPPINTSINSSLSYSTNNLNWTQTAQLDNVTEVRFLTMVNNELAIDAHNPNGESYYISVDDGEVWTNALIPVFTNVFATAQNACAISTIGKPYCWGDNTYGQVGYGQAGSYMPLPKQVESFKLNAEQITGGRSHICALNSINQVSCWGQNEYGQLGTGDNNDRYISTPIAMPSRANITSLTSGLNFNCILDDQHNLYCWGRNKHGQFVNTSPQTTKSSNIPTPLTYFNSMGGLSEIAAGYEHVCGISVNNPGVLYCWGDNKYGELGNGFPGVDRTVPETVATDIQTVSAGGYNTCAIDENGHALCWGNNQTGQVGNGRISQYVSLPTPVMGNFKYKNIYPGVNHTCAITRDDQQGADQALCWGNNGYGQLGNGKASTQNEPNPQIVTGGHYWLSLTVGYNFTCGIAADDRSHKQYNTYCWGHNDFGQVGINDSSTLSIVTPSLVNTQ